MSNPTTDLVQLYLKEIGRHPLLTPQQEIAYARQVQQMMTIEQAKATLTQQMNRQPTLAELAAELQKTEAEVTQILHQGQRAKQKMVESNLRLVVAIAKKYQNRNMEFLDLIQEGALGLQRGVEKFDPNKGYKLSTYAYWWVTQSITRAIAQTSRTIRLPVHLNEVLNKIKKAQRELAQTLGRTATVTEIAEALKLKPDQIREYLSFSKRPISLDLKIGEERETDLLDILPDESEPLDKDINLDFLRQDLKNMLGLLSAKQREVVILRFGLEDGQQLNLREVGERLNLSRERVRQIEVKAMNILRRHHENVADYLAS